jgi:hypothetical protein
VLHPVPSKQVLLSEHHLRKRKKKLREGGGEREGVRKRAKERPVRMDGRTEKTEEWREERT